jgi:hypothetical protein
VLLVVKGCKIERKVLFIYRYRQTLVSAQPVALSRGSKFSASIRMQRIGKSMGVTPPLLVVGLGEGVAGVQ